MADPTEPRFALQYDRARHRWGYRVMLGPRSSRQPHRPSTAIQWLPEGTTQRQAEMIMREHEDEARGHPRRRRHPGTLLGRTGNHAARRRGVR